MSATEMIGSRIRGIFVAIAALLLCALVWMPANAYAAMDVVQVDFTTSTPVTLHEGDVIRDNPIVATGSNPSPLVSTGDLTVSYTWEKKVGEYDWIGLAPGYEVTPGFYRIRMMLSMANVNEQSFTLTSGTAYTLNGVGFSANFTNPMGNYALCLIAQQEVEGDLELNDLSYGIADLASPFFVGKSFESTLCAQGGVLDPGDAYEFRKVSGPSWIDVASDGTISGTPFEPGENNPLQVKFMDTIGQTTYVTLAVGDTYEADAAVTEMTLSFGDAALVAEYGATPSVLAPVILSTDPGPVPYERYAVSARWVKWMNSEWVATQDTTFGDGRYAVEVTVSVEAFENDVSLHGLEVLFAGEDSAEPEFAAADTAVFYLNPTTVRSRFGIEEEVDVHVSDAIMRVGERIAPVSLKVYGGTPPYTFSKLTGPSWIRISPNGSIAGTPTAAAGESTMLIEVKDMNGSELNLTIPVGRVYGADAGEVTLVRVTGSFPLGIKTGDTLPKTTASYVGLEGSSGTAAAQFSWQRFDGDEWVDAATDEVAVANTLYRPKLAVYGDESVVFTSNTQVVANNFDYETAPMTPGSNLVAYGPVVETSKININDCSVEIRDVTYNGAFQLPYVVVTNSQGDRLAYRTDYDLFNAGATDAGIYSFYIGGIGDYTGSRYAEFRILPRDIRDATMTNPPVVISGTSAEPNVSFVYKGKTLVEDVDYEITDVTGNTAAGTGWFTVVGKGNFTNTIVRSFEILSGPVADNSALAAALQDLRSDLDSTPGLTSADFQDALPGTVYVTQGVWQEAEAFYQTYAAYLDDPSLIAEQIETHTAAVRNQIDEFDAQKMTFQTDKSSLTTLITQATAEHYDGFGDDRPESVIAYDTPSPGWHSSVATYEALGDAITAAQAVVDNPSATRRQIANATGELQAALNAYMAERVSVPVPDSTNLAALLATGRAELAATVASTDGSDVNPDAFWLTSERRTFYQNVFDGYDMIGQEEDFSQSDIDGFAMDVQAYTSALMAERQPGTKSGVVDKSELMAASYEAGYVLDETYGFEDPETEFYDATPGAWWVPREFYVELQAANEDALDCIADPSATQEEVESVTARLESALSDIYNQRQQVPAADMTAYEAALRDVRKALTITKPSADGTDVLPTQYWVSQTVYDQAYNAYTGNLIDDTYTQEEIDGATATLRNATDLLVNNRQPGTAGSSAPVDKTELGEAIDVATDLLDETIIADGAEDLYDVSPNAWYVDTMTYTALEEALAAAQGIYDDPSVGNAYVKAAYQQLSKAIDDFEAARQISPEADMSQYEATLNALRKALTLTKVSTDGTDIASTLFWVTQSVYDSAYECYSGNVIDNTYTQYEIDMATNTLQQGLDILLDNRLPGLQGAFTPVDKTELGELLAQANAAIQGVHRMATIEDVNGYVPGSMYVRAKTYDALADKIAFAQEKYDNPYVGRAYVIMACQQLSAAITSFEQGLMETPQPSKTMLQAWITRGTNTKASAVSSADGTDVPTAAQWVPTEVYKQLADAVRDAEAVYSSQTASANDVNDAIAAIQTAREAFTAAMKPGTFVADTSGLDDAIAAGAAAIAENATGVQADDLDDFLDTAEPGTLYVDEEVLGELTAAYADAVACAADPLATQEAIDDAAERLSQAIAAYDAAKKTVPQQGNPVLKRIWGDYANETSAKISAEAFESSDWVVIARDDDFADALGSVGLAGALDAPIILTDRFGLSEAAAAEIGRLGAKHAYIIGGTGAIKTQVDDDLVALGVAVEPRIWGDNSYDTSLACAREIEVVTGARAGTVIIAMSTNFQDALSMSPYAYKYKVPVVLQTWGATSADRGFTDEAQTWLKGRSVLVAGGAGAISDASISGLTLVDRLWGDTGYDTSQAIAEWMVGKGYLGTDAAVLACGAQAPKGTDALAGAALAGKLSAPMLLVNTNTAMEEANTTTVDGFLSANKTTVKIAYVLGGAYVMPEALYDQIASLIGAEETA